MAKMRTIDFNIFDAEIDKEFQTILPEASEEDKKQLEENILADGEIRDPYIVWENPKTGTFFLVDGHHRLQIMKDNPGAELSYTVKEADFADRWEAVAWILANCIGRRNLNDVQQKMIIAKYSKAIKMTRGGDHGNARDEKGRFGPKGQGGQMGENKSSRQQTAEKFGVGETTVRRAVDLSNAIDEGEEISPGFAKDVESGDIKASQEMISNISKVPEEHRSEYVGALEGIRKGNEVSENQKNRKEAQDIYNRYTKEAVDKATESLEGYDNDPFENTRNGDEEDTEFSLNSPELHIKSVNEEEAAKTVDGLKMSLEGVFLSMERSLEIFFDNYKEVLETDEGKEAAEELINKGEGILLLYKNKI